MDFDTETFITEVFTRSVVWDQRNKHYHNRILFDNNWKNIEDVMKQPRELLKKKWKCLRDQFRSECKKIPVPRSGDPGMTDDQFVTCTTWPHFKSLLFLKDQIKHRKSSGNLTASSQSLLEEIPNYENLDDTFNAEGYLDSLDEEATVWPIKKKVKSNSNQTEILAIERKNLELLEKKANNQKKRNDDEDFFNSLIPFMEKMDLKMLCRMEIQKVVYKHAFPISPNTASVAQCPSGFKSASDFNTSRYNSSRGYNSTSVYNTTDDFNSAYMAGPSTSSAYRSAHLENASSSSRYYSANTAGASTSRAYKSAYLEGSSYSYNSALLADASNFQTTPYEPCTSPVSPVSLDLTL